MTRSPSRHGYSIARSSASSSTLAIAVVALALSPKNRQLSLQSSVVGPDGRGVSGLPLGFRVRTATGREVRADGGSGRCEPGWRRDRSPSTDRSGAAPARRPVSVWPMSSTVPTGQLTGPTAPETTIEEHR